MSQSIISDLKVLNNIKVLSSDKIETHQYSSDESSSKVTSGLKLNPYQASKIRRGKQAIKEIRKFPFKNFATIFVNLKSSVGWYLRLSNSGSSFPNVFFP